jgi:hypothetical protein
MASTQLCGGNFSLLFQLEELARNAVIDRLYRLQKFAQPHIFNGDG